MARNDVVEPRDRPVPGGQGRRVQEVVRKGHRPRALLPRRRGAGGVVAGEVHDVEVGGGMRFNFSYSPFFPA